MLNYKIRRAIFDDARGIHNAHMRSIQELCSVDYCIKQIDAWGRKAFDQEKRVRGIKQDIVYVVIYNEKVEGFAQLTFDKLKKFFQIA